MIRYYERDGLLQQDREALVQLLEQCEDQGRPISQCPLLESLQPPEGEHSAAQS